MTLDTTFLGYGIALVLMGWFGGVVVAVVFSIYRKFTQI
jgi:hypothetical protein